MWEGIMLGLATFAGFWAIFRKFPRGLRKVISHPKLAWITDISLTIGAYILLSGISSSFAAAMGCAIAGILVSMYLEYCGEYACRKKTTRLNQ
jgi:hypothetical protein